jgi:uncharacterized protein YggU (UPF0235/DUF167 family)
MNLANLLTSFGDRLQVRVTSKAADNYIKIDDNQNIRIYVTTIAEGGKANKKVISLLSKELKIPQSNFSIIKGLKSRDKIILIKK